jgi:hypothetical protein
MIDLAFSRPIGVERSLMDEKSRYELIRRLLVRFEKQPWLLDWLLERLTSDEIVDGPIKGNEQNKEKPEEDRKEE